MSGVRDPGIRAPASGTSQVFPGPAALGRGLVVLPGMPVPEVAREWPRHTIDQATLEDPADAVAQLDALWRARQPSTVELAVRFADLKQPEVCEQAPYELSPEFDFARERLHFLVWANRYDLREGGRPRWHHTRRALALGAREPEAVTSNGTDTAQGSQGDIRLPDGRLVWIDGGPRTSSLAVPGDVPVLHVNQLWAGVLGPDSLRDPGDGELAPDQAAAVAHPGGPARVLAPAGSGKTRVLTARLRHLLADRGWTPDSVTALAYNNRAAAEMRFRTRDLGNAQVRTLHSLGYEILGRFLGRKPKLLAEWEVRRLLEPLAPVRHRANDDVYAPYLEALAEVRAALRSPGAVEAAREDVPGFAGLFDDYRDRLASDGAIDHDEQIYGAVEVLLRDPDVRQDMQRRCAHVLLDELQDLTPAQLLMVRLLAAPAYDVYGVGDDDQVIYGYAGADPRFLVDYERYFPGAASFLLEVNYRCPPPVVEAASKLLAHNRTRVAKVTRPAAAGSAGSGSGAGSRAEALLVERVREEDLGKRLLANIEAQLDSGAEPSEIAVLTRVNAGLLAPQVLLDEAGVPIEPAVDERMLDRTGARAALAWVRLAMQAGNGQPLEGSDLAVAARRPPRKLSRGVLGALGRGDWQLRRLASFASGVDDNRLRTGLEALHQDLDRLGRLVRSGGATTARLLTEVRDSIGLGGALEQLDGARSSSRGGHGDDLDALILVAGARPDPASFEPWLRQTLRRAGAARSEREAASDASSRRPRGGLVLSTVHRVKGLEWPHVIVWDASEGVMPHQLTQGAAELEEERRVFHVAMTRARHTVTVLARAGSESPFLDEMSGAVLPKAVPDEAREGGDAGPEDRLAKGAEKVEKAKRRRGKPGGSLSDGAADPATTRSIEALKGWRLERARADNVPAFVVLNDRHLEGIAARAPADLDELAACDGIGPAKLARYGQDILQVLGGEGE